MSKRSRLDEELGQPTYSRNPNGQEQHERASYTQQSTTLRNPSSIQGPSFFSPGILRDPVSWTYVPQTGPTGSLSEPTFMPSTEEAPGPLTLSVPVDLTPSDLMSDQPQLVPENQSVFSATSTVPVADFISYPHGAESCYSANVNTCKEYLLEPEAFVEQPQRDDTVLAVESFNLESTINEQFNQLYGIPTVAASQPASVTTFPYCCMGTNTSGLCQKQSFQRSDSDTAFASLDDEVENFFDASDQFPEEGLPLHSEDPSYHPLHGFETDAFSHPAGVESPPIISDIPSADPPLYDGASVSESEAAFALLTFMLSCKISGQVLSSLIGLIQLLLPPCNRFFSNLHSFHKYFERVQSPSNFVFYCGICFESLESNNAKCSQCGPSTKVEYYLHIPITDQLRELYSRSDFIGHLSYRFSRTKTHVDNLEDIYDGELYKSYAASSFSGPLNTSFTWNTDGISFYKSSSYQVWPIYLVINELPPHLRHKDEFVLLAGLAFGYEKPKPNVLLKPIYNELLQLRHGIEVSVPNKEIPQVIKCVVLDGSCDAPAKSLFFRMNNFNGFFGCPKCYARGEKSNESGNVFAYRYENDVTPRTKEGYENDLRLSRDNDAEASHGVKGPTFLFPMMFNFFLTSTAIDAMHCVYLGVCRQILFLWFHPDFIKLVFGERAEKKALFETLSKLFCELQPPHYFSRCPRSLKHLKYFKAAELRTLLFSTLLPVLQKHMKEPYFAHFQKLVWGVALLNKSSISHSDIVLSKSLLKSFVMEWQQLFGLRHMSFNLHCLLHLSDCVSLLGPLWVTSCFQFESLNGLLARLIHGTRQAGLQIHSNLGLLKKLPSLVKSIKNSNVKKFCDLAMTRGQKLKVTKRISNRILVVGKVYKDRVLPGEYQSMINQFGADCSIKYFLRLKQNGYLFVSEQYGRGERNSSCVLYQYVDRRLVGSIKVFLVCSQCQCEDECNHTESYHAVIERFSCSFPFEIKHESAQIIISTILLCTPSGLVDIVPIKSLQCVTFKMKVGNATYLSLPLNEQELE